MSSSPYGYSDYVVNADLATIELGRLLNQGSLHLFLGAGASKGFGLPGWKELITRVLGKENDAAFLTELPSKSDKDMALLLDPLDDGSVGFQKTVRDSLFGGIAPDLVGQLQHSPLLLAVAALATGSCRGRVTAVTTYNFDDLLEQYMKMLGYAVCVRLSPDQLSTKSDVEVSHPHGFLPQSWSGEKKLADLIFSERSYRTRRVDIDKGWSSEISHALHAKIGLFIGLSGDDTSILDVMERTRREIARSDDYTGYWLMTGDAFKANGQTIRDVGMCPIQLDKEKMPQFVLKICRAAANSP